MQFVLNWLSSLDPTIATIVVSLIVCVLNILVAFTKTSNRSLSKKLKKMQLQIMTTFDSDEYDIVDKLGNHIQLDKCTLVKKNNERK